MLRIATLISMALLLALPASADRSAGGESSGFSLGGGIGFTGGPGAFQMSFEAPYAFDEHLSAGPLLQLGLDADFVLVMASANAKYGWRFSQLASNPDDWAKRLKLVGQGGLGVSHLSIDIPSVTVPGFGTVGGGTLDDTAFLINFGVGAEYDLTSNIVLTSHMLFNIHAGGLLGDNFTFSWQMIGARYRF